MTPSVGGSTGDTRGGGPLGDIRGVCNMAQPGTLLICPLPYSEDSNPIFSVPLAIEQREREREPFRSWDNTRRDTSTVLCWCTHSNLDLRGRGCWEIN